ncbi:MAG: PAS domain S-box protein, partial [Deltaproteobacteria bacterium]|nr:PAS domain S-box protein [Deltaproteobacteria bacterium]
MTKKPTYEELEQNLKRVEYEFQKDRDDRERLIEEHTNRWRRSEARLQNLMETVPIGISISTSGTNGIVTEINSALFKIFGYSSKEEFLKIPASAHYYNSKDRKTFSDLHKDGPVINYETRFKRKDGTVFWGSICSGVCPTEDGNFEFYNTFEDITKQKQAEDKLLESEAGLSKAQQMVHIGNWNWNIVENKILWSDELYRIIGLSPQQFDATYEAYLQCIHPDDLEFFKNLTRKILRDKKPYTAEHRIVRPNGDVRTVQVLCEINVDTNGDPIDLFGTMQDITERKHKEEQYQTIIQTAIDG